MAMEPESEDYNRAVDEFISTVRRGADDIISDFRQVLLNERTAVEAYARRMEAERIEKNNLQNSYERETPLQAVATGAVIAAIGAFGALIYTNVIKKN